ncbi:hypothetical protein COLO4_09685 [Corchorus olitorius]|uniref:Uncharacterized protein n=1 Tax=Corchorus olitorius TaxID=93759 RepID=A0A1R3KBC9_9ROSI|nr:hypothetical protein COLO4_09685 [Corchorus olitorius]
MSRRQPSNTGKKARKAEKDNILEYEDGHSLSDLKLNLCKNGRKN